MAKTQSRFSRRRRTTVGNHYIVSLCFLAADLVLLLPLTVLALVSRTFPRPYDVGLGPIPLINNVYHKRALAQHGYRVDTFVDSLWNITLEFDHTACARLPFYLRPLSPYILFVRSLFLHRAVYIYFCGGPLRLTTLLALLEPGLYRLAGIRTVVMPFGADVNVLTRTPNLLLKHGIGQDYPGLRLDRRRIASLVDSWTRGADFIIGGCDWVDYLYHWDKLMLAHFSIDTAQWRYVGVREDITDPETPLRVLHAPNHRALKGTDPLLRAVDELREEGVAIELRILEDVPNSEIHAAIAVTDVVVDQLVIGAYAMFALEAMATGKPTICHMRRDLENLFVATGLVEVGEIPLIDADVLTIKDVLRNLTTNRDKLPDIGRRSRAFVEAHHSIERIGDQFHEINQTLGLTPSGKT